MRGTKYESNCFAIVKLLKCFYLCCYFYGIYIFPCLKVYTRFDHSDDWLFLSLEPPQLRKSINSEVISEGNFFAILCQATRGSLPLRFQWLKDGQAISKLQKEFQFTFDEMSSKLNIKKVSSFHSGNYTCSVQNDIGIDAYTVKVTVKGIHDDAIRNDN